MSLFVQFAYLQLLDLLTTLAFLTHGGKEANPVVRFVMSLAPTPLIALIVVKSVAFLLAFYCIRHARLRLLARVNVLFAVLVAWNLCVLIVSALAQYPG